MNTIEQAKTQIHIDPFIKLWEDNYNRNLSGGLLASPKTRPLMFLANNLPYSNVPIILIVAGPSVDKNIQHLKDYKDNCIIICADVVLFKLLEHGIKPDFVINVDPHESITRFWKSLDTSDITLICPTTTNPNTIKYWQGKIFFYNQTDIEGSPKGEALKRIIKPTKNWGNVFNRFFIGATMFQISTIFRPSSIILIGYDFGFTDGKAYCDGFLDLKLYHLENPEGSPEWQDVLNSLKVAEIRKDAEVKISLTESIWTTKEFLLYKRTFIALATSVKFPVINSTEGGILLEIPRIPLKQSLATYCINLIEKSDTFSLKKRKRRKKK